MLGGKAAIVIGPRSDGGSHDSFMMRAINPQDLVISSEDALGRLATIGLLETLDKPAG